MNPVVISISRKEFLASITGKSQKYCIDCKVFFEPTTLELDSHASHYTWFLPLKTADFDKWIERIKVRDEQIWGALLDEDGVRSQPFCPSEFNLEIIA